MEKPTRACRTIGIPLDLNSPDVRLHVERLADRLELHELNYRRRDSPSEIHSLTVSTPGTRTPYHCRLVQSTPPGDPGRGCSGAAFTVEFDTDDFSLKLVKQTGIPEDEPISCWP